MKRRFRPTFGRLLLMAAAAMAFAYVVPAPAKAATRAETLEAIHHIENPRNSPRPGRHGELGPYQFRRSTWRMYTKMPFDKALDRAASEEIAIKHYEWLKRGLARNGWKQTPYTIALAWNAGLTAVINGRTTSSTKDYAQRVANLATELKAARLATSR